ncbi:hypothetical protein HZS_1910, partial [Henneguya salminicola]
NLKYHKSRFLSLSGRIGNLLTHCLENRKNKLEEALNHFNLFLSFIINYGAFPEETLKRVKKTMKNIRSDDAFAQRDEKIRLFKERKATTIKMANLQNLNKSRPELEDDDITRQLYLLELSLILEDCLTNYSQSLGN